MVVKLGAGDRMTRRPPSFLTNKGVAAEEGLREG